jgi:Asparagine synthase/Family of unknown function (DUF6131)
MTMAWGLEARVPFLDHDFVELAATCPPELKLAPGGKGVLKGASRSLLPGEVIDRTKGYFPVPGIRHLDGEMLDLVRDALTNDAAPANFGAPLSGPRGCSLGALLWFCGFHGWVTALTLNRADGGAKDATWWWNFQRNCRDLVADRRSRSVSARLLQDGRGKLRLGRHDRPDRDRRTTQLFRRQPEGDELQAAAAQQQWASDQRAASGLKTGADMIVLGIILLLIGLFVQSTISPLLTTVGVILIVVGAVLWILGRIGRPVAGRRYWY